MKKKDNFKSSNIGSTAIMAQDYTKKGKKKINSILKINMNFEINGFITRTSLIS